MFLNTLTRVNRLLAELCGWLLILVMAFIVVGLVGRGISQPVYGVLEMAMFTMIAIVYLGLAHAEEVRGHVRVEFLIDKLPRPLRAALEVFAYVLASVMIAIVLYAVSLNAWDSYLSRQAIAGPRPLVIYPVKFAMVVALVLYLAQLCVHTALAIARLREPERDDDTTRDGGRLRQID